MANRTGTITELRHIVVVKVIPNAIPLTVVNNLNDNRFAIPVELDGTNIVSVGGHVFTVSSSGVVTFQLHNFTDTTDVLSTALTIDQSEKDSSTAATPAVINAANDDVNEGEELQIDVDGNGTGTAGAEIRIGFQEIV